MPDGLRLCEFLSIVRIRGALGYGKRGPIGILHHFSDINDLADVVGIVRQLAADGFQHGVAFIANVNDSAEVGFREGVKRREEAGPAFIPAGHDLGAGGWVGFKFRIALTPFFFAVGGKEVGPTRQHIAPQVFDNHRNAVAFGRGLEQQRLIGQLRHGLFADQLVVLELLDGGRKEEGGHWIGFEQKRFSTFIRRQK